MDGDHEGSHMTREPDPARLDRELSVGESAEYSGIAVLALHQC